MTAAAAQVNTPKLSPESTIASFPVSASVTCYKGAIAALTTLGYVRPAATNSSCTQIIGVFMEDGLNSAGASGAKTVNVDRAGTFRFANSASTDAIATANIGQTVYAADDATAALLSTGGRLPLGTVVKVDSDGVWVRMGLENRPTIQAGRVTLVSGTVTVSNVRITAASTIVLTSVTPGGTAGFLSAPVATRSLTGDKFVVNSSTNADTTTVDYLIIG